MRLSVIAVVATVGVFSAGCGGGEKIAGSLFV